MPTNPPTQQSYDLSSRLQRARDRAALVDNLIGLRGKRVLEIGCGHGDFCRILADEYNSEVIGIDILENDAWEYNSVPNASLIQIDISRERFFEENSFDRIVSFVAWEHIRHPWSALRECQRILRPDGRKYIHAYLYGAPRLSHLHYALPEPWLHLTHSPREILSKLNKTELPWYFWCNRISYLHYLQYFRKLGFYVTYENFIRDPFPEEAYKSNEQILGLYSEHDLRTHGFQVVLEFDQSTPKAEIVDLVYSKLVRGS